MCPLPTKQIHPFPSIIDEKERLSIIWMCENCLIDDKRDFLGIKNFIDIIWIYKNVLNLLRLISMFKIKITSFP